MTCESNRTDGSPIDNRGTVQIKASIWGAVAYGVAASLQLHPGSPERAWTFGEVWVAMILGVLSAIPVLVALVITDFIRGWIGRVSVLVLSVPVGWIGLFVLLIFYPSIVDPVMGHERRFEYFGESQFAAQLLPMFVSEVVLLAVTFKLWPWFPGGETLPRNPE